MNGVISHAAAEVGQLGGRLHHEAQLVLHFVQLYIAPQQKQVFVCPQLVHQELEELHELLRNGLRFVVEEEEDVLGRGHPVVKVVPRQLVWLLGLLGLSVGLQVVALGPSDELLEGVFGVGARGNVEHVILPVDRHDVLLVAEAKSLQGR